MFHLKSMSEQDFPFAVRITDQMNWNMVEEDFRFMVGLEPEGCFVLFADQERVGIATTVSFGKIGWFGNLIVSESNRKKGAGSLLVKHSIEYLRSKGVETVGLLAYIDKVPFYRKLGFECDSDFIVLTGKGFSSTTGPGIVEAGKKNLQQIIDRDSSCFGASRRKVLEPILCGRHNLGYRYMKEDRTVGFVLAKVYDGMADLGPLVCPKGCNDIAISLLKAALNRLKGSEVSLCLPAKEKSIVGMLVAHGFAESFRVARMFFHPSTTSDCVYVAESLERG
jgi:GNAT superfamily N-acetyltransferase